MSRDIARYVIVHACCTVCAIDRGGQVTEACPVEPIRVLPVGKSTAKRRAVAIVATESAARREARA